MSGHLKQQQENSTLDHKRFQFLELLVNWEGGIEAEAIKQHFQISAQLAGHVITKYKSLYPNNLKFNGAQQNYQGGDDFVMQHCLGSLDEYIALSGHASPSIEMLATPMRKIEPKLVRPILKAIRDKLRLNIHYASVSNPEYASRFIQPHNLVFDGLRWHVRAYCEKNNGYRDFVLSRFKGESAVIAGEAKNGPQQDALWNEVLQLEIMPDSRLDQNRKRIIAMDYDMDEQLGEFTKVIPVRAALLMYLMQRLRLDRYHEKAGIQQIIVSPQCQQALKQYL